MKLSIVSRLSLLYAVLLGITVMVVIVASSIALVVDLYSFNRDIVLAKHEEARVLVDQYRADGMSLKAAAPQIANALQGIGLSVAVFDDHGNFLAGDKSVHPRLLARIVAAHLHRRGRAIRLATLETGYCSGRAEARRVLRHRAIPRFFSDRTAYLGRCRRLSQPTSRPLTAAT